MRTRVRAAALAPRACHEGTSTMIDGKAKLTREDYCDGLGGCLPPCPNANLHNDFIRGRITLIGCPKLDATDKIVREGLAAMLLEMLLASTGKQRHDCAQSQENAILS